MPKNLKLKEALNRHKGVDHKLERQKKLQKEAEKKKRAKKGSSVEVEELEAEAEEDEDNEAEKLATSPAERKREKKSAKKAEKAQQATGEADGWETDDSEDGDDNEGGVEVGAMEDESDSDSEEEFQNGNAGEDDEDEDIPLSDIESLASEDRGDIIPHQRLTINNTAALQRSLKAFALPSTLPFSATQSVTSAEPVQIADVEDDLNRELAFYRQSLDAVTEARAKLKKEGVPFTRPTDYFAEMVKSEEQMGKVRSKLLDETARKKASADARRQRDLKKFGKAVQVAKLQERAKEKTATLDRIQTLKRSKFFVTSTSCMIIADNPQSVKVPTSPPMKTTHSTSLSRMPRPRRRTTARSGERRVQRTARRAGSDRRRTSASDTAERRGMRRATMPSRRVISVGSLGSA
jgi:rRNA-processing protein EBP2